MSTKRIDTSQVVKLHESNYEMWKLQISLILQAAGVWTIVDGSETRPASDATLQQAFDQREIQARAIIIPTLTENQICHIVSMTTAKQVWDQLKDVNSDTSALNKQHVLSSFLNYKIGPDTNILTALT